MPGGGGGSSPKYWRDFEPLTVQRIYVDALLGWLGTPYLLGGNSKSGTDCSGLLVGGFTDIGLPIQDHSSNDFVQGANPPAMFYLLRPPVRGPRLSVLAGYTSGTNTYGHIALVFRERWVIQSTEMANSVAENGGVSGVMITKLSTIIKDIQANFSAVHERWLDFDVVLKDAST